MRRAKGAARRAQGDRTIRSLVALQANGSTARTLNLASVWMTHGDTLEYRSAPFFRNTHLNRSIILKHRLRNEEHDAFQAPRNTATKVILPIDLTNLAAGGRSFFINERSYRDILRDLVGGAPDELALADNLLQALDELPSLDPFLMRERLKRAGFTPARCYFEITKADMDRMLQFVCNEVTPLIGLSFTGDDAQAGQMASKLANKILSDVGDVQLDPLRMGLGMDKPTFEEGVFCWKGFLYFKWILRDLLPQMKPLSEEIATIRPTGKMTSADKEFIALSTLRIRKNIIASCDTVRATLSIYDDAYAAITQRSDPHAFRDFLLSAPKLFNDLGERMGSIQHLLSFWRYRFPAGRPRVIAIEELADLLTDFETSISVNTVAK